MTADTTADTTADERTPPRLPPGLREPVLAASQHARGAGRSVPDVADISAGEAFRRAADAFNEVLCTLDDDDWQLPVVNRFDVQGLVGHLIGVELDMHRCVMGDPGVADLDHVESTRPVALLQVGVAGVRTRTQWRRATVHTQALVDATSNLDTEVGLHGIRTSLGTLLIVRAFELWTDENDICRAVGRPLRAPDGSTLRLMTAAAAGALPIEAARIGLHDPTQVRLVLTGMGGGTWDVGLGLGTGDVVAIRIVADAVAFCRLAANRITPGELGSPISGDVDRASRVLAAVSALALD